MNKLQAKQEFNNWCNERDDMGHTRLYRCTKHLTGFEYVLVVEAMRLAFIAGYTKDSENGQLTHASSN